MRGSGRFKGVCAGSTRAKEVFQSPSLRGSGRFKPWLDSGPTRTSSFQSPSLRGSGRFTSPDPDWIGRGRRFNPLHCGAVVASRRPPRTGGRQEEVSIPFIAGQWSLLMLTGTVPKHGRGFQSPSLRGSGRFMEAAVDKDIADQFQSPSLRGSGRFSPSRYARG